MQKVYTYRTAARRVHRSIRAIQSWRHRYFMRVTIDPETGEALISEAELLRCYRSALAKNKQVIRRRHQQWRSDTLAGLELTSMS